jgi:cytochrome P450
MSATAPDTQTDFLEEYLEIEHDPDLSAKEKLQKQTALVMDNIGDPRAMCASLRENDDYAIFDSPVGYIITRFRDNFEVLDRDDVFSVEGYGARMAITTGPFMLGMDTGEAYQHESSVVRLAMPMSDLPGIRQWLRERCSKIVAAATENSDEIDVVQQLANVVPTDFVAHYFGVPGPSTETLLTQLQAVALYIFNFWAGGEIKTVASRNGLELQLYLDGLIQQRRREMKAGHTVPDDVLTRLLVGQVDPATSLDDVAIRRNLGGLSIGCTGPPSLSIASVVDELMNLSPDEFAAVRRAAEGDDDQLLTQYILEADRLGAPQPGTLWRTSTQDYVLAKGTKRETFIPAGSVVVVVLGSAMMDGEMVDDPKQFRVGRPDWVYAMFGRGMHWCIGAYIGKLLMTEAIKPLLKLPDLHRAKGKAGHIQPGSGGIPGSYFPGSFKLKFKKEKW